MKNPNYAMTYPEIAEKLGVSKQRVAQCCASALRKLRRRPYSLAILIDLGAELQRQRYARASIKE
jgi:DNA-directed RNA polymerase sigma subunit (sigma70/sigma32)